MAQARGPCRGLRPPVCVGSDQQLRPTMSIMSTAASNSGVPIAIHNVSKVFGEDTDKPFLALKPVNVAIAPGEFISVVGASGCGKSTLMLMVAGLLKQTSGEVRVGNALVTEPITDVGIA